MHLPMTEPIYIYQELLKVELEKENYSSTANQTLMQSNKNPPLCQNPNL